MKNVAIFMQSRTGSSMVAAVFRAHGWEMGGDKVRTRDYTTHENQVVKAHLVSRYGGDRKTPVLCDEPDDKLRWIMADLFGGDPWAWKGDFYYRSVWVETFPELAEVYVQRDIGEAIESGLRGYTFPLRNRPREHYEDALRDMLNAKYSTMAELVNRGQGTVVNTTMVRGGVLGSLRAAVEACGGDWDESKARGAIR